MKLEASETFDFITSSPSTGAAADADSLPTCEVFEDATDTAIQAPTVVKRTGKTGNYRTTITAAAASGYDIGKTYNAVVSATVGGVTGKARVAHFPVTASSIDDAGTMTPAAANAIADALLDRADGIETGLTLRQAQRLIAAAAAGKVSGAAGVTIVIRNVGDTKPRITATVDADGNRSAVTYDLT